MRSATAGYGCFTTRASLAPRAKRLSGWDCPKAGNTGLNAELHGMELGNAHTPRDFRRFTEQHALNNGLMYQRSRLPRVRLARQTGLAL